MSDRLARELEALGRALADEVERSYDPGGTADAVLALIGDEPVPAPGRALRARRWLRRRWRLLGALLTALAVALVLTPPVRAGVAGWFDLGGVSARVEPPPVVTSGPPGPGSSSPPPVTPDCGDLDLDGARRRIGFTPLLPAGLGAPESAGVSAGGRVLSLCWRDERGRVIRVDEFEKTLEPWFYKTVPHPWEPLELDGSAATWFPEAHRLDLAFTDGTSSTVRPAGPTLVWERDGLTLRLEGVTEKDRAASLAGTFRR
ncbi:hypothetical protein AB0M28_17065 [Streptomyces sp. NPDC051940]|uniref:hypothetical protein n=1 Tax=Streptomyces sp. NPDC051940 TaxID=3155675 RepID=UPI0034225BF7